MNLYVMSRGFVLLGLAASAPVFAAPCASNFPSRTCTTPVCTNRVFLEGGAPKINVDQLNVKGHRPVIIRWVLDKSAIDSGATFASNGVDFKGDSDFSTPVFESATPPKTIIRTGDGNNVLGPHKYDIHLVVNGADVSCDPTINNQGADDALQLKNRSQPQKQDRQ